MESDSLSVPLPVLTPAIVLPRARSRGRRRYSLTRIAMRRALSERLSEACAAAWQAVPPRMLRQATRCTARVASARQAAIYFAHVVFAANLTRAGGIFGRDRTTARHACFRMEDWRDDARIDRAFDALEPALRVWLETFASGDVA